MAFESPPAPVDAPKKRPPRDPAKDRERGHRIAEQDVHGDTAGQTDALKAEMEAQRALQDAESDLVSSEEETEEGTLLDKATAYFEEHKQREGSLLAALATVSFFALEGGKQLWGVLTGKDKKTEERGEPVSSREVLTKRDAAYFEEIRALMEEFDLEPTGSEKKDFFSAACALAQDLQEQYGIPWQVMVAQACLESGFGTSGLTRSALNCFGYKLGRSRGPSVTMQTFEYEGGKRVKKPAAFRKYAGLRESFESYARLISSKYKDAFQFKDDPRKFLETVIAGGYATTPPDRYVKNAERALHSYGLTLNV